QRKELIMPSPYPYLVYPEADEVDEADELFGEHDEADEADEASRPSRRRFPAPGRTQRPGGTVLPRPAAGFATRAELTATANRLDLKIAQASAAIKTVDGRVRTLDSEQSRLRTALTAETKKREALAGQVNNLQQMSMLLPLLSTQATKTLIGGTGAVIPTGMQPGDKVVV